MTGSLSCPGAWACDLKLFAVATVFIVIMSDIHLFLAVGRGLRYEKLELRGYEELKAERAYHEKT